MTFEMEKKETTTQELKPGMFVTEGNNPKIFTVYQINESENSATILGLYLNSTGDMFMAYNKSVSIDEIQVVDESFVCVTGPLWELKVNIENGEDVLSIPMEMLKEIIKGGDSNGL